MITMPLWAAALVALAVASVGFNVHTLWVQRRRDRAEEHPVCDLCANGHCVHDDVNSLVCITHGCTCDGGR